MDEDQRIDELIEQLLAVKLDEPEKCHICGSTDFEWSQRFSRDSYVFCKIECLQKYNKQAAKRMQEEEERKRKEPRVNNNVYHSRY